MRLDDVPADRAALLVDLAARDREGLPELAAGVGSLGHGELGIEAEDIAARGVGGLEQALVDLAVAVDAAGADRHRHLGEAAVGQQLAAVDRLDVVQVEHG